MMDEEKREYYLKEGRLDLSTLDLPNPFKEEKTEQKESFSKEEYIIPPRIYKDAHIEDILKEMGEYFSNE